MKIEHSNYVVKNVDKTLTFLQTAFPNAKIRGRGDYVWHGQPRKWLHFGSDDFYIAINSGGNEPVRDTTGTQIGLAHLGFEVENLQAVIDRLSAKGFEIDHPGDSVNSRNNVYYIDPNGLEFEFVEYTSTQINEKNKYT